MSSVSTILYTLLANNVGIGTKCYPQQIPQETNLPALCWQVISTIPTNTKGTSGASKMDRLRVQITIVANSQTEIDTIGQAVRSELDYTFQETINSTYVQLISFQSENDSFDPNSGQDGLYLKYQDYFITISR